MSCNVYVYRIREIQKVAKVVDFQSENNSQRLESRGTFLVYAPRRPGNVDAESYGHRDWRRASQTPAQIPGTFVSAPGGGTIRCFKQLML